jgi:DNA adenine methylase
MRDASPLRYPGGKWRLSGFFERIIAINFQAPPKYVEPYAGGASLALSLLFKERVREVWINDLDPAIHAFWHSVLKHPEEFSERIKTAPLTPSEWKKQKKIYANGLASGRFALGFATFYLNRTNHSGILNGGMIGGKNQTGPWTISARFNRDELARRVLQVSKWKSRIHLSCKDAALFLNNMALDSETLLYLDPPYFRAGRALYLNAYRPDDHEEVRDVITSIRSPWIVSYDYHPRIRKLYVGYRSRRIDLLHTARTAKMGRETLFFSPQVKMPLARWMRT